MEAVDQAYESLSAQTMDLIEYSDTSIKGSIEVTEAGRLIFSIPKEDGWKLYVNGQKTEILDFKETFLSVYLEEGQYDIELRYMTPGLKTGAILSFVCVGLFILTMLGRKGYNKCHLEKQKILVDAEMTEMAGEICEKID